LLLFALIASFCHYFGALVLVDSAEMSVAPIILKESKYWQKLMQNDKNKQIFGTGLNLVLVLHLAQCQLNVMNVPHYLFFY